MTFQFLFHFYFTFYFQLLLFNGILFAHEITNELVLLFMNYDVALRLENVESQK